MDNLNGYPVFFNPDFGRQLPGPTTLMLRWSRHQPRFFAAKTKGLTLIAKVIRIFLP
jgi:hypothetical protein